jgi:hypothetical protein
MPSREIENPKIDFSSEKQLFRKKSARIYKKSIDPFCESYMFVLHPETGEMVQVETSVRFGR